MLREIYNFFAKRKKIEDKELSLEETESLLKKLNPPNINLLYICKKSVLTLDNMPLDYVLGFMVLRFYEKRAKARHQIFKGKKEEKHYFDIFVCPDYTNKVNEARRLDLDFLK